MINWLSNYWYDYQLKIALKQGNQHKAKRILKRLEIGQQKLSCLATLYKQQLEKNNSIAYYQEEITRLTSRLEETITYDNKLKPQPEFINYVYQSFKLNKIDHNLIQSTGIDKPVFTDLEIALVDFITEELNKIPQEKRDRELANALNDLTGLKKGIDPAYSYRLTPHVFFIKYFLDNIYCLYLAWFMIYEQGLLRKKIKILDLASGVNTSIFSLAILSSSLNRFSDKSIDQVSYYSLEQQADLQYRGLQFWRKYIESYPVPLNAYFRFNTVDLFDYQNYFSKIPQRFFDFIVISHCFFYESKQREQSCKIYQQIFQKNLNPD
ncbi:MAG: photosystem II assembly protein [Pleurocapsa sp.]